MYTLTGITGQVGAAAARHLIAAGRPVRAVVRNAAKGQTWAARGCKVALADMNDPAALTAAFAGSEAVFILLPPNFDPSPGFPEIRAVLTAIRSALLAARPGKVVCLSTIGAQAAELNLLSQLSLMEALLGDLPMPVAFLRPAWFIENAAWDVASALGTGVISSFLQPLDRKVPMVATDDVGRTVAGLLQASWNEKTVVELEGPQRISPLELAAGFSRLIHRPVRVDAVPRETWETLFKAQGMQHPQFRMRMLDGFNEGWIKFSGAPDRIRKGIVSLESVLAELVQRSAPPSVPTPAL